MDEGYIKCHIPQLLCCWLHSYSFTKGRLILHAASPFMSTHLEACQLGCCQLQV